MVQVERNEVKNGILKISHHYKKYIFYRVKSQLKLLEERRHPIDFLCNNCEQKVTTDYFFLCNTCFDYGICAKCYSQHPHKMKKFPRLSAEDRALKDFDAKLDECQVINQFEPPSLRRTKSCTKALMHELSEYRGAICHRCKCDVSASYFYYCTICAKKYDKSNLCTKCYLHKGHPHKMEKIGINLTDAAVEVFRDYLHYSHHPITIGKEGIVNKLRQLSESRFLKDFDSKLRDCQVKNWRSSYLNCICHL